MCSRQHDRGKLGPGALQGRVVKSTGEPAQAGLDLTLIRIENCDGKEHGNSLFAGCAAKDDKAEYSFREVAPEAIQNRSESLSIHGRAHTVSNDSGRSPAGRSMRWLSKSPVHLRRIDMTDGSLASSRAPRRARVQRE
jgi:hypothetical protein